MYTFDPKLFHQMYNTSGGGGSAPPPPPNSLKRQLSLDSLTIDDSVAKKSDHKTTPQKMAAAKFNPFSSPALDAPVIAGGNSSTDVDNDGEKITDNALNVLDANLEQLNHQQGSEAGAAATAEEDVTFAGKVKVKRVNRAYPYAAFIMGGDVKIRTKISRKHFTAFTKHYNDRCDELPDEEQELIDIEFCSFEHGIGVIACADSHTLKWIKKEAEGFFFEKKKSTLAWARWERGSAVVYSGFLHGENWKYGEPPSVVIGKALKKKNIPGTFTNCIFNTNPPNGVHVSFEPDLVLARELDKNMCSKVKAHKLYLGRRLRKQHTEAEFVEFLSKKNAETEKRLRENAEKKKAAEAAKNQANPEVAKSQE